MGSSRRYLPPRRRRTSLVLAGIAWALLSNTGGAYATPTPAPAWNVTIAGAPSLLPSGIGHHGRFDIVVENVGGAQSESGATVRDTLPAGLTVTGIQGAGECSGEGTGEATCTLSEPLASGGFAFVSVEFEETTALTAGASLQDTASVSGGGGTEASGEAKLTVKEAGQQGPGPGGIAHFSVSATDPAGEPMSQAAAHPTLMTTAMTLNTMFGEGFGEIEPVKPAEAAKDLVFYLPVGLLGDATVADECPASLVETHPESTGCPPGSRIGTVLPLISSSDFATQRGIYNVTPEKGYPAEFAFTSNNYTFFIYASLVRREGTYMTRLAIPGVPAVSELIGFVSSFYGDIRERFVANEEEDVFDRGAFLTDPSDCGEGAAAREAAAEMDTWEHPDHSLPIEASSTVFRDLTGCESLSFFSSLHVTPETTQADEPSGLEVGVEVPQAPDSASGLATPPVKDMTVMLPLGTALSPSAANGLAACAETGPQGFNIEGPESEELAADGLEHPTPGHCPMASAIGTVTATAPLLREELKGHVFLATPSCGGKGQPQCTLQDAEDGHLFGLYMELEGPESGVVVKLKGHASVQSGSGRIATVYEDLPQFPISKLVVSTKRGARAPLANPQDCTSQQSNATLTPWSPGVPASEPSSTFSTDWNGAGQSCPHTIPFSPKLTSTTAVPEVASTSPLTLTLAREDREQNIDRVTTTLPEGMLAKIAGVTRCPEPQASQDSPGACPAASQIGTATVAVGPGNDPYEVTGKVFFTGPYEGAPFGLSIVAPAQAGPFDLGDVLVRAKLFVDPHTAQVTAVSDPLPQELDRIPLRLRSLSLTFTGTEFVLNPTSCATLSINASVTSTVDSNVNVSTPFAAVGCDTLPFKPEFSSSTEAHATQQEGTGVNVEIAYPTGREANIAKLVVGFPEELPARQETLQKACPAATFEANPATCPATSNVGTATVDTPLLAQPLTGPVFLVSHEGAKFPDTEFVLQGEGVTIVVDGQSSLAANGALTSTFTSIPDAPFSSLQAKLPAAPNSLFTNARTHGTLCGEKLVAAVTLVAHDGGEINENTSMAIAGCPPSSPSPPPPPPHHPPPHPRVSIKKVKVGARGLTLEVTTSLLGRLRIDGHGLRTLLERGLSAGTHELRVQFSHAGRTAEHKHRRIMLTVSLTAGAEKAGAHRKVAL